jgi:2-keto-3-deoxy-L-fuconate dehydrogenase
MDGRLRGKTAICTAAGQGIGRAVAVAFASEGAHVVASDVELSKLEGLDDAGIAETAVLDVTSAEGVVAFARGAPTPDILFNCAGWAHHGTVLDCSDEDWERSFEINVTGMHRMIRAFLPIMLERGGGSIINVGSVVSSIKAAPDRYAYAATKAAVIGLTKAIAIDFIRRGVRCNCICPGTVQSPSLDERIEGLAAEAGGKDNARARFVARQPMARIGTAEEVAALAVYLAAEESAFTTGVAHVIDGGFSL